MEKTTIAISAPHKIDNSFAFLNKPVRRFENVTCLVLRRAYSPNKIRDTIENSGGRHNPTPSRKQRWETVGRN
ncbi:hypothetical protein CR513_54639, partial [Mucuna pruriens]